MPQWFRFYNEAVDDRKLKKIARDAEQPFITVMGAWAMILAFANNDHDRGYMLYAEDVPMSRDDIVHELSDGIDEAAASRILFEFETMGMIAPDTEAGAYIVTRFAKRNYESDHSAERVRRHRARKKREAQQDQAEPERQGNGDANNDVTPCNGYSNAPDTETESETDPSVANATDAAAPPPKPGNGKPARPKRKKDPPPAAVERFREATNRYPNKALWSGIAEVVGEKDADLERWHKTCLAYVAVGWNPGNVKNMLTYYQRGEIPGNDGRGMQSRAGPPPPQAAAAGPYQELDDYA